MQIRNLGTIPWSSAGKSSRPLPRPAGRCWVGRLSRVAGQRCGGNNCARETGTWDGRRYRFGAALSNQREKPRCARSGPHAVARALDAHFRDYRTAGTGRRTTHPMLLPGRPRRAARPARVDVPRRRLTLGPSLSMGRPTNTRLQASPHALGTGRVSRQATSALPAKTSRTS